MYAEAAAPGNYRPNTRALWENRVPNAIGIDGRQQFVYFTPAVVFSGAQYLMRRYIAMALLVFPGCAAFNRESPATALNEQSPAAEATDDPWDSGNGWVDKEVTPGERLTGYLCLLRDKLRFRRNSF